MASPIRQGAWLAGMMLAGVAQAQQATPPATPPATTAGAASEPAAADAAAGQSVQAPVVEVPAQGNVTTLGEVRALKPEDDQPLDLYRFRSPVQPAPNRFSKSWSEPPSPEQVSMSGGYLFMGINYGLMKAAQGLHKLTGGRDQIQSAIARPPPLTAEQLQRAAAHCAQEGCAQPADGR